MKITWPHILSADGAFLYSLRSLLRGQGLLDEVQMMMMMMFNIDGRRIKQYL